MTIDDLKAKAIGQIPSGLFVVACKDGDRVEAYLASWLQQASFEPLLLMLAIKPNRKGYEAIKKGNIFSVNVVGENNRQLLEDFWSGYPDDDNPFYKLDYTESPNGGIWLSDAKSVFDCKYIDSVTPGDHEILIIEAIDGQTQNEKDKVLVHIRETALDY